jgi:hypothetical protein
MRMLKRRLTRITQCHDRQNQTYDTENSSDSTLSNPMREYPSEKTTVKGAGRNVEPGIFFSDSISDTFPDSIIFTYSPTISPQQHCKRCSDRPRDQHENRMRNNQLLCPITTGPRTITLALLDWYIRTDGRQLHCDDTKVVVLLCN